MQFAVLCLLLAASLVIARGQSWENTEGSNPGGTLDETVRVLCENLCPQPQCEEHSQNRDVHGNDDDNSGSPAWFEKFFNSNFYRNKDSTEDGNRKRRHVDVNIVEVLGSTSSSKINVLHDNHRENVPVTPVQTAEP